MSNKTNKDLMNGAALEIGQAFMRGIKAAVDVSLDERLKPAIDEALDEKFKEQEDLILSSQDAFEKRLDDKHDAFEKRLDEKYGRLADTISQNTQAQINAAVSQMRDENKDA